jgi:hypothetical protein
MWWVGRMCNDSHFVFRTSCAEKSDRVWDKNLMAIWHMFTLSFKMLQTDPNEIGNMFSNFTDSDSSIFEDKFFPSIHIFYCFACRWTSRVFGTLTEVTPLLNLENHLKTQQTLIFQRLAVEIYSSSSGHHLVGVLETVVLHHIITDIYTMFVKRDQISDLCNCR